MAGRPTKLTPKVQKRICDAIRAGNYIETAAAFAGVTSRVVRTWMAEGRKAQAGKKREFVDAVEQALAEAEVRDVAFLAQSSDWKARAFKLARRFPARWGSRTEVQHSGHVDLRQAWQASTQMLEQHPDEAFRMAREYAKRLKAAND